LKILNNIIIYCAVLVAVSSCSDNNYVPKPYGYPRISFPEKEYKYIDSNLPYSFKIPVYSNLIRLEEHQEGINWVDINFPKFKGSVHISYWQINNDGEAYFEDARRMVYKHTIRAESIKETRFENVDKKVYGLLYELSGDAASNIQFVLTDSTHHFIRGALYLMSKPNADSLAPVVDFMKKDIIAIMESCEWKN